MWTTKSEKSRLIEWFSELTGSGPIPKNPDLENLRGPERRIFSELVFCCFSPRQNEADVPPNPVKRTNLRQDRGVIAGQLGPGLQWQGARMEMLSGSSSFPGWWNILEVRACRNQQRIDGVSIPDRIAGDYSKARPAPCHQQMLKIMH